MRTPAVLCLLLAVLSILAAPADRSSAAELATVDEALADTFGDDAEIQGENVEITASELARIETETGKILFTDEEKATWTATLPACSTEGPGGAESAKGSEPSTLVPFYFATKDGKALGAAAVVSTPGKWDMVEYFVGMDPEGTVTRVEVLKSSEKRGREVARRTFMAQFEGKTAEDPLTVGKDITAVSGATVTSKSACLAVTRATVLYKELYLTGSSPEATGTTMPKPAQAEGGAASKPTGGEAGGDGTEEPGTDETQPEE